MKTLNLYKIFQNFNDDYDTYDAAIVAALNADGAKAIHPGTEGGLSNEEAWGMDTWAPIEKVVVVYIGKASVGTEVGVILSSFNAG